MNALATSPVHRSCCLWHGYKLQPPLRAARRAMQAARRQQPAQARSGRDFDSRQPRPRLGAQMTSIPGLLDDYFEGDSPQTALLRRLLWSSTAAFTGYYAANTVSLSFGALAINDVVAAAVTVGFAEVVSALYWSSPTKGLTLQFANCFKLGALAALIADAFKLGG